MNDCGSSKYPHLPSARKVTGILWGGGFLKANFFKKEVQYEASIKFLGGRGGGVQTSNSP